MALPHKTFSQHQDRVMKVFTSIIFVECDTGAEPEDKMLSCHFMAAGKNISNWSIPNIIDLL